MALNGWLKKAQITIAASKLPQTQTNQVVVLSTAHFPTGMVTLNGTDACKSDGGDIRFSSDTNGDTLLPFDIIKISLNATPANSVLLCAFKINVTANASFSIWCHWGNSGATRLAPNDTYGAANCWSEIYGIMYLQENPADVSTATEQWKFFKEATNRYSAASEIGAAQQVAGPIAGMNAVAISPTIGIRIPEVITTGPSDTFTVAAFIRPVTTTYPGTATANYSGAVFFAGASEMLIGWSTFGECKWQYAGGYVNPQFGVGKGDRWRLWVTQVSGTNAIYYLDPTLASFSVGSITTLNNLQYLGGSDTAGTVKAGNYHICMFMIGKFATTNINWFRNLQKNFDNITTLATPGSIQSVSVSAALTLTGVTAGTEIRVYRASDMVELSGIESSSGDFTYNYNGSFSVHIVIHKPGLEYIRFANVTLPSGGLTIPIQQESDIWYTASYPANVNTTNILVTTSTKVIEVKVAARMSDIYAFLMDRWKADAALIDDIFPIRAITDEQFILNDSWTWKDTASINNIRSSGWSRKDASGNTLEEYLNLSTLGSFTGTAYYLQTGTDTATSVNAVSSGAMNQAVKVYGNASNGNIDLRSYLKVYIRNLGYTFQDYDLVTEQQLTTLTFKKYSAPLANITDTKILTTNTTTLNSAPYNTITLTRYTDNIRGAWVASTSYAVGDVVKNTSNRWVRCSTAHTSGASYVGTNWTTFNGERQIDSTYYAFRFILNGGGLTLQQIYSRCQYLLSRTTNIVNTGTALNGVNAPRLTSYLGDVLQTFNGVFIDNFAASDVNKVEFYDYAGTKAVFPLTVSFSLTGLQAGTEVRIYRTSDMVELSGVESSTTSFAYSYTYSTNIPVTIVIHVETFNYISFTTTLTNQSTSVPIQQFSDLWYTATIPTEVNATNVVVVTGTNPKTIEVKVPMGMKEMYSYLKQLWKTSGTLIKEPFPITAITDEQFIINDPWTLLNTNSVNNIRNAGWSRRDASDVVLEEYMNVTTLGNIISGSIAYTNSLSYSATTTTAPSAGAMNNAIKIYGDLNNGNFDHRNSSNYIFRTRTIGYVYSEYDLVVQQQIPSLTFRRYVVPLSNIANTKASVINLTTLNAVPYTNVTYVWQGGVFKGIWASATSYVVGDIVKNPSNRWVSCTTAHTSTGTYASGNFTAYSGERLVEGTYYAFEHIINANSEPLQVVYDRFQRNMQHGFGINTSGTYVKGTVSILFFEYVGDTLVTNKGTFIDGLTTSDKNKIEFTTLDNIKISYQKSIVFELTGLITDTEIRLTRISDGIDIAGTETSSTSFNYTYNYSSDIPVNVFIHKPGYIIQRFTITLSNVSQSIPITQIADLWYTGISTITISNVTIDIPLKTIEVNTNFNLIDLYNILIDYWKTNETIRKEPFPLDSITSEQFILKYPWDFTLITKSRVRNAGWRRNNSNGTPAEMYIGLRTLGTIDSSDFLYWQRTPTESIVWPTNFIQIIDGKASASIQIYGDASNGNFDSRTYFAIFFRTMGNIFRRYELTLEQDIQELTYKLYSIPMESAIDPNSTYNLNSSLPTNQAFFNAAPYTNILAYYYSTPVDRVINGVTRQFNIVIQGDGKSLNQIYNKIRFFQYRQNYNNMYTGGGGITESGRSEPINHMDYVGNIIYTSNGVYIDNFDTSDNNNIVFRDINGVEASNPKIATFTLTGLQPNSEIRIYNSTTSTEIDGIENSGTIFTYSYVHTVDIPIIVVIHNVSYRYIRLEATLTSDSASIPIQQEFDRNYSNP